MDAATRMRRDEGVNLFKFDGIGRAPLEMEAMLGMLADVRKVGMAQHVTQKDEEKGCGQSVAKSNLATVRRGELRHSMLAYTKMRHSWCQLLYQK